MTEKETRRVHGWRALYYALLGLGMGGLILVSILYFQPAGTENLNLRIGTVAPVDLIAPFSHTFDSQVLTDQQRENAARAVQAAYTSPDTRIARNQVDALRDAVAYISTIRADNFASLEQKSEDLALLDEEFTAAITAVILLLTDEQWQSVQAESVLVLQQIMRGAIREEQLDDARRSIPTLVSYSLPEDLVPVVTDLVSIYIAPNSFYNAELTEERRQIARDSIQPVTRSFVEGETVVRRGKALNDLDLEALQQLGLLPGEDDPLTVVNAVVLVIIAIAFVVLFIYRRPSFSREIKHVIYTSFFFLLFLYSGRIIVVEGGVSPYIFPLTGFGLLIGALFGPQPGVFMLLPLSLLLSYGMPNALEALAFYVFSGVFAVLMLDRARRVMAYIWAGSGAGVTGAVLLITFRLLDPFTDVNTLLQFAGFSLVSGLGAGILSLFLLFFTAPLLGKVTVIQLTELSRPDHPLLRFILLNAPGTYQHSLQVANLSEQAAERIGADPFLTRIGALYHDCGKALNPQYFIENQIPGAGNPHEHLDPYESSRIIIRHVTDGLDLARKHRMPERIIDFIAEHHGTTATRYQYAKALEAAGGDTNQVSLDDFRYPGPRPRTRETALVMLADGCEARARAERPATETALREMIKDVLDKRLAGGQLANTNLTIHDLVVILESFVTTLRGIYHPRIEYPKVANDEPSLASEPESSSLSKSPVAKVITPKSASPAIVPTHDTPAN